VRYSFFLKRCPSCKSGLIFAEETPRIFDFGFYIAGVSYVATCDRCGLTLIPTREGCEDDSRNYDNRDRTEKRPSRIDLSSEASENRDDERFDESGLIGNYASDKRRAF
jgi:hypothetical protein